MKKLFSLFAAVLFAGSMFAADMTCADAREAALNGSTAKVTVTGYVTNIAYALSDGSMSFWMADTKDGGKVFEAYKCAIENEDDAPVVGDKVKVTGNLTVYEKNGNKTPELAAGCTCEIIERAQTEEITTCAAAAEAALAGNTSEVTLQGFVTAIQTAWSDEYNNISFWIADTKDGGKVLQAYRAKRANGEDGIPGVGDKVEVKGQLTKYNSTPELAQGCTFEILVKDAPAVNLGEKTIAEFLALKNVKDTCVLTGKVANIVMDRDDETKYNSRGNFDLEDETGSVYIYGLLTADGQSGKFIEMDIDEGDILTLKAIYTEYQGNPQAANAIYVSHEKAQGTGISNTAVEAKAQKIIRDGQIYIVKDGQLFNLVGASVK